MSIRCTHCRLPMTSSEAAAGRCPSCKTPVRSEVRTTERSGSPIQAQYKEIGFFKLFLFMFVVGILFQIVVAALFGFRSGSGGTGVVPGVMLGYGILQGLGYRTRKQLDSMRKAGMQRA
jgi:hypothetical protein